jgi:transposase
MNYIENLWAWIKNEVYKRKRFLTTPEKIWNYSKELFFSDDCESLI